MNEDTLHLLSECASGTDMAIRSLEDVLKNSAEGPLQKRLLDSKRQHEQPQQRRREDPRRDQPADPAPLPPGAAVRMGDRRCQVQFRQCSRLLL